MSFDLDWLIIGAGPAGQKAAIQAAKAGCSVAIVERGRHVGGECVHRGTIPSKSLRETALRLAAEPRGTLRTMQMEGSGLAGLLSRVGSVVDAHVRFQQDQLLRNDVRIVHGHARFLDPHRVRIDHAGGESTILTAERVVVATGSVPWRPPGIEVDHEYVLDSDSVLSLPYLPESLVVIGGGVIACEYATVFKHLGSRVTMIDRGERPMSFLDVDLSRAMVQSFSGSGCRYMPRSEVISVEPGAITVECRLRSGERVTAEKVLLAVGRTANLGRLGLVELGARTTPRGHLVVDDAYRTTVPDVLAVGDVIGFPALAATSMEQGRRAVRLALDLPVTDPASAFPIGIYSIPEFASVGLTEDQAIDAHGEIRVGVCDYAEVARGQISGQDGMLKLLSTADRSRLLGVHVVGDAATEVVHLGQMALIGRMPPSVFVDHTFNFPTLAEAYRIAALALERPTAVRERQNALV